MANSTKPRKKKSGQKRNHSNNLRTTGLFNRRDETSSALARLEVMSDEERRTLMEALVQEYGKTYFRINIIQATYEKVGPFIDIYMLMKLFWDIKITIYSLPKVDDREIVPFEELDQYELFYQHRVPTPMSAIREIPVMIISNFMEQGTEPFLIRVDLIPVLPLVKQGEETVEEFTSQDIHQIEYWYDGLNPHNAEFKHRPRTCDPMNGWSEKKFEENRNAILRKLL